MSFYASVNELLEKHLEYVTREILTRFFPKRLKLLSKLLDYSDTDLESVKHVILYASILHDVGKAYEPLQEIVRKTGKAPHHEIFSTFFSDIILTKMKSELKIIVLLTIAWHHSATRGMVLERIGETTNEYLPVNSVKLSGHSKEILSDILNNIFSKFECGEEIDLSMIPEVITVNDAKKLLNKLGKSVCEEKSNMYKTYFATLPVLTALQIADAKVAFENRGGSPPIHLKDLTRLDAKRRVIQVLKDYYEG